jgi:hypothetical protein
LEPPRDRLKRWLDWGPETIPSLQIERREDEKEVLRVMKGELLGSDEATAVYGELLQGEDFEEIWEEGGGEKDSILQRVIRETLKEFHSRDAEPREGGEGVKWEGSEGVARQRRGGRVVEEKRGEVEYRRKVQSWMGGGGTEERGEAEGLIVRREGRGRSARREGWKTIRSEDGWDQGRRNSWWRGSEMGLWWLLRVEFSERSIGSCGGRE